MPFYTFLKNTMSIRTRKVPQTKTFTWKIVVFSNLCFHITQRLFLIKVNLWKIGVKRFNISPNLVWPILIKQNLTQNSKTLFLTRKLLGKTSMTSATKKAKCTRRKCMRHSFIKLRWNPIKASRLRRNWSRSLLS